MAKREGVESIRGKISLASLLSIAAGILILFNAVIVWAIWSYAMMLFDPLGFMVMIMTYEGSLMMAQQSMQDETMEFSFWPLVMGISTVGTVSGMLVLFGAIMLRVKPEKARILGFIILIFSIIAFLGMGGFLIGTVIGIVGGALAIARARQT